MGKKIILIEPHAVISKEVKGRDLKRVIREGKKMLVLCHTKIGLYHNAYAIAHAQITKKKPLRFFVEAGGTIIVNPVIVKHTKVTQRKPEGCMTFAQSPKKMVDRYTKCEVEFQFVTAEGRLSPKVKVNMSGVRAQVFQHELDHMNCRYIYTYIKPSKNP